MAEGRNPRRKRLRIERDQIEPGVLLKALEAAHDNDAAGNTIKFIIGECFALEGSRIGHGC